MDHETFEILKRALEYAYDDGIINDDEIDRVYDSVTVVE